MRARASVSRRSRVTVKLGVRPGRILHDDRAKVERIERTTGVRTTRVDLAFVRLQGVAHDEAVVWIRAVKEAANRELGKIRVTSNRERTIHFGVEEREILEDEDVVGRQRLRGGGRRCCNDGQGKKEQSGEMHESVS